MALVRMLVLEPASDYYSHLKLVTRLMDWIFPKQTEIWEMCFSWLGNRAMMRLPAQANAADARPTLSCKDARR